MLALNLKSYQAINRNSINLIKMTDTVYYLTGRGGQLKAGVGKGILERGVGLAGRAMSGQFERLEFQSQIDLISQDLQDSFGRKTQS